MHDRETHRAFFIRTMEVACIKTHGWFGCPVANPLLHLLDGVILGLTRGMDIGTTLAVKPSLLPLTFRRPGKCLSIRLAR